MDGRTNTTGLKYLTLPSSFFGSFCVPYFSARHILNITTHILPFAYLLHFLTDQLPWPAPLYDFAMYTSSWVSSLHLKKQDKQEYGNLGLKEMLC